MSKSNRPRVLAKNGAARTHVLCELFDDSSLAMTGAWQDALDPELPSDPVLAGATVWEPPRPRSHKLLLLGILLGAGLQALGYLGASWLL